MRRFITLALGVFMASTAVTVQGFPVLNSLTCSDTSIHGPATPPLDLNLNQLTQCVTQILDGAQTCDVSLLDGLVPGVLKPAGGLLSLDGHILDLSILTGLVNNAVVHLLENDACKHAKECKAGLVVKIVQAIVDNRSVAAVIHGTTKGVVVSDIIGSISGDQESVEGTIGSVTKVVQDVAAGKTSVGVATRFVKAAIKEVADDEKDVAAAVKALVTIVKKVAVHKLDVSNAIATVTEVIKNVADEEDIAVVQEDVKAAVDSVIKVVKDVAAGKKKISYATKIVTVAIKEVADDEEDVVDAVKAVIKVVKKVVAHKLDVSKAIRLVTEIVYDVADCEQDHDDDSDD
ncbi:hypothetical protein BJV82DRAFT_601140 [Fennellomyces sp. T-0311]|nr:hypothetical protein BJV82DRAFT_601140 [Fennellomyces sp. T-0311]